VIRPKAGTPFPSLKERESERASEREREREREWGNGKINYNPADKELDSMVCHSAENGR